MPCSLKQEQTDNTRRPASLPAVCKAGHTQLSDRHTLSAISSSLLCPAADVPARPPRATGWLYPACGKGPEPCIPLCTPLPRRTCDGTTSCSLGGCVTTSCFKRQAAMSKHRMAAGLWWKGQRNNGSLPLSDVTSTAHGCMLVTSFQRSHAAHVAGCHL